MLPTYAMVTVNIAMDITNNEFGEMQPQIDHQTDPIFHQVRRRIHIVCNMNRNISLESH